MIRPTLSRRVFVVFKTGKPMRKSCKPRLGAAWI